jgi:hypothetical protein
VTLFFCTKFAHKPLPVSFGFTDRKSLIFKIITAIT